MNATANVVVAFPRDRIVRTPIPLSVREQAKRNKKIMADRMTDEIIVNVVGKLAGAGVDVADPNFTNNYAMTMECLRATLYESFGIKHPFQPALRGMVKALTKSTKKQ